MRPYSRREFISIASSATGALALGCSLDTAAPNQFTHAQAMITARPGTPTQTPTVGYSNLGLTAPRDGILYVPNSYNPSTPAPLMVMLHDALGSGSYWQASETGELLDDLGIVILAPDSRFQNWDLFLETSGGYRDDPRFINNALAWLFQRCNINASRIAMCGLGDGATETIGLGLANGDLFTHVIALAPGALYAPFVQGKPKVMVAHGALDASFVIEYTKLNIVPKLNEAGYNVNFVEYDGPHIPPPEVVRQAAEWFMA